jgi:hypothetical protein
MSILKITQRKILKHCFSEVSGIADTYIFIPQSMIPASRNERIPPKSGGKVTGSGRKTQEIDGTWKQYPARIFLDFF